MLSDLSIAVIKYFYSWQGKTAVPLNEYNRSDASACFVSLGERRYHAESINRRSWNLVCTALQASTVQSCSYGFRPCWGTTWHHLACAAELQMLRCNGPDAAASHYLPFCPYFPVGQCTENSEYLGPCGKSNCKRVLGL